MTLPYMGAVVYGTINDYLKCKETQKKSLPCGRLLRMYGN